MSTTETLPSWKKVWRDGFCPVLPTEALEGLREALATDDRKLLQQCTTQPPPLMCVQDWPCEGGCVLGYMGAVVNGGFGTATVGEVEEMFARWCFEADQRLGEPAACRWFLNFWDDTPRPQMIEHLLEEVNRELARRQTESK